MATFEIIIFDLDGTLIDSSASILASYQEAFAKLGISPRYPLTSNIVGPPLFETLALLAGTSDTGVLNPLAEAFKLHYDSQGYQLTTVFGGINSLLDRLATTKIPLYIATNKRLLPTRRILDYLGWTAFFSGVYALDSFMPALGRKADLLAHMVSLHKLPPTQTLYVGDRREDAEAAQANGMPFALALWGYGGLGADAHPADGHRLSNPEELLAIAT